MRTEIWPLRSKLSTYNGTEGKDNPLRIGFRPRSLVPLAGYRSSEIPSVFRPGAVRLLQRIAMLPFVSIGRKNEAFNDGLATDATVRLGTFSGLRVISRTSPFEFKGHSRPVREILDEDDRIDVISAACRSEPRHR